MIKTRDRCIARCPLDDPEFCEIVVKFSVRLEERLAKMDRAWDLRDFDELDEQAHWLKGAGGTVGYADFTEPALELEMLAKRREESSLIPLAIENLKRLAKRIRVPDSAGAN